MPISRGTSRPCTALRYRVPIPGQLKTVSVKTAPTTRLGMLKPITVMTGRIALGTMCRQTTPRSRRPLALAVVM